MILMSTLLTALFGWALPDPYDAVEEEQDDYAGSAETEQDPPVLPLDLLLADWDVDWDTDVEVEPSGAGEESFTVPDADAVDHSVLNDAEGAVDAPWETGRAPDFDDEDGFPPVEPVEVLYLTEPVTPGASHAAAEDPFHAMFDAVTGLTPPGATGEASLEIMMDGKKVILPRS